jgi:argininosuccinate lyase
VTDRQCDLTNRIWQQLARVITAHVVMLGDEGVLDEEAGASLLASLDNVARATPKETSLIALLVEFDTRVDAVSAPGVHGASVVGRGTADVTAAVARLILRDDLLDLTSALERALTVLIDVAAAHTVSLMPAYSHGQPAQPTTLGHYLGGLIGPLERAAGDLHATYEVVNRSPLGAGALASSATAVDRADEAALLGFSAVVDNTFDAVAAVDHFARCGDSASLIAAASGRFLRDLLTWWRAEPSVFRLSDEWLGHEPGLPQVVAPVGLESLLSDARSIQGDAAALGAIVADADYAPAIGVADELLRRTHDVVARSTSLLNRLAMLLTDGLEFNRALLANRAGRAFSTMSDLADFLMIEEQLEPATARAVAALTYARATEYGIEASGITPEIIDGAAMLAMGRELKVEFEAISRYLAPRRFIERRTATGAPSPLATRAWLDRVRDAIADDRQWREAEGERVAMSLQEVNRRLAESPV